MTAFAIACMVACLFGACTAACFYHWGVAFLCVLGAVAFGSFAQLPQLWPLYGAGAAFLVLLHKRIEARDAKGDDIASAPAQEEIR